MSDKTIASVRLALPSDQIESFCRRYHIRRLALFGSVLRDDFDEDSDVDVLVEFAPGKTPDFFELYTIEHDLSVLLGGRAVDLVTTKALNHYLRDAVLDVALPIYDEN